MPSPVTFRFDAKNKSAQQAAAREAATLVTNVTKETKSAIRALITRSIREGIPPREAAVMIRDMVGMTTRQAMAAMRFREQLIESGLSMGKVEKRTATYIKKKIRERAINIARTECLLGDVRVSAAVVRAVFRRRYHGKIIEVRTKNGNKFSATPNHPMLTNRGWVAAGQLTECDYLICDSRQQYVRSSGNDDIEAPPPTISEIFDAAVVARGVVQRACTTNVDFHGDGLDGEVDVVWPDRELVIGRFSALYQPALQDIFAPSDLSATPFCSDCGRLLAVNESVRSNVGSEFDSAFDKSVTNGGMADFEIACNSADRLVGSISRDDFIHGNRDSIGSPSPGNASILYCPRDPRLAETDNLCHLPGSHPGCVKLDGVDSDGVNFVLGEPEASNGPIPELNATVRKPLLDQSTGNAKAPSDLVDGFAGKISGDDFLDRHAVAISGVFASARIEQLAGCRCRSHNTSLSENAADPPGVSTHLSGNVYSAHPGKVELDRVLTVSVRSFSGHVFNLYTSDGYFALSDGLYTGNTITALAKGQDESWAQAQKDGFLSAEATEEWITTPDARTCPICVPMDGQVRKLGKTFTTGDGREVLRPGGAVHPSCRCAKGIHKP